MIARNTGERAQETEHRREIKQHRRTHQVMGLGLCILDAIQTHPFHACEKEKRGEEMRDEGRRD